MPLSLQPVPDDAVDLSFDAPQYSSDFASTVGNAGDDTDGFEAIFSTLAAHLADAPNVLTGFDGVLSDVGTIGDPASIPFEQEFSDSVSSTISEGQSDFDAFHVHLTGDNPPASGGTGGGSSTPSTDCGKRDNKYGISKAGTFAGVTCDWKMQWKVLRVQDGPCSEALIPGAQAGDTHLPTIDGFTLLQGDTKLWKLGHSTAHASDGTPYDQGDVTVNPSAEGHYEAVGLLSMNKGKRKWHVCMSLDVIP